MRVARARTAVARAAKGRGGQRPAAFGSLFSPTHAGVPRRAAPRRTAAEIGPSRACTGCGETWLRQSSSWRPPARKRPRNGAGSRANVSFSPCACWRRRFTRAPHPSSPLSLPFPLSLSPPFLFSAGALLEKLQQQVESLRHSVAWRHEEAVREREQLRQVCQKRGLPEPSCPACARLTHALP